MRGINRFGLAFALFYRRFRRRGPGGRTRSALREMGPQTPRDISSAFGLNPESFPLAPPANEMNLCNIHTHTNAEHKGPGFGVFVSDADDGGYACNETAELSAAELAPAQGAYKGVKPGDTIEVHWVHTSVPGTRQTRRGTRRLCSGRLRQSSPARGSAGFSGGERPRGARFHRTNGICRPRRWPASGEDDPEQGCDLQRR